MSYQDSPTVQMIAMKHDFADGRYVTLMVTKYPQGFVASLFGSELEQINHSADDFMGGRTILEAEFARLFPEHICSDQCRKVWHELPDSPEESGHLQ
jgi:hypothetical protein